MNESIVHYLEAHTQRSPGATAFTILEDGEAVTSEITWLDLLTKVQRLAITLLDRQLTGERVLLVYQDMPAFLIAFLACQYAGIVAVPVSYIKGHKQVTRLLSIVEDAQANAILCREQTIPILQQGLSGVTAAATISLVPTDTGTTTTTDTANLLPRVHDIAFIQYTSGSTAKPKGVVITAGNLLHNQQLLQKSFGCDEGSVIFSWLPFHHDMGLIGNLLHTIYIGCHCVVMSPFHFMQKPLRWLEGIVKYKATHSGGPNFAYDLCVEKITPEQASAIDLSGWTVAYNGSEPIRSSTIQNFSNYFKGARFQAGAFCPCYGLAEATLLVTGGKREQPPVTILVQKQAQEDGKIILATGSDENVQTLVSSGKPAAGMELRIISPTDQQECAEGETGELCIAGDSVTKGYWNQPNEALYCKHNGKQYLKTGDLGFMYNGELFVRGRRKEMLILRGQNIYPNDIEAVIARSHIAIEPNGVAVFSLQEGDEEIVVVAELKRAFIQTPDREQVIHAITLLVQGLFGFAPYDVVLTTPLGIPRTTSGKLQRIQCRDRYRENGFSRIGSAKTSIKKKRVHVAQDPVLLQQVIDRADHASIKKYLINRIASKAGSLQQSDVTDSTGLTEMGLDSLRALELINTINRELHINIDMPQVMQENSLSGLIGVIENILWLKQTQLSGSEIII